MPTKSKGIKELNKLYTHFQKAAEEMVGYPLCQLFDYSKLFRFLKFHINNLGDPFLTGWHYRINTLHLEREVIDYFAKLYHAPKDTYWGYVTNGGTEGNLYGLYIARELHPNGIVIFSDQSHYSINKNLNLLRMEHITIPSIENGEIDYHALQKTLHLEKRPPIIVANIGTTMKGAVDDVVRIKEILSDLQVKEYYIHCDAAFFGMILPFVLENEVQPFDFRLGIDSIAISGHKIIGTPTPCGIIISKKSHLKEIGSHIEYTGAKDNTISGSRNGLTPLFLWYEVVCAENGLINKIIHKCIENAGYAIKKFSEFQIEAWRNKNSIIVIFPRPSIEAIQKWQLAIEGDIAHLITLPHVTKKMINKFVNYIALDLLKTKKLRKKPLPQKK